MIFHLGNYCCDLPNGKPGCCEITKEWKDKGYVPALPPFSPVNNTVSMTQPKTMNAVCPGTQCGQYCFPNSYGAKCCDNPRYACNSGTKCCSNSYDEQPWCCQSYQRCAPIRMLCFNGAFTMSAAMTTMLFAFMIGIVSKCFL